MTPRLIETFALFHLTVMGLSHVMAHQAWARFFVDLAQKGTTGVFVVGWLSLGFGSIIAAWHPVWAGVPLLLTLLGWSQVLKGAAYLCVPAVGLRALQSVSLERSRVFIAPGIAFLALAGLLGYHLMQG